MGLGFWEKDSDIWDVIRGNIRVRGRRAQGKGSIHIRALVRMNYKVDLRVSSRYQKSKAVLGSVLCRHINIPGIGDLTNLLPTADETPPL